jgi:hypothetical protein
VVEGNASMGSPDLIQDLRRERALLAFLAFFCAGYFFTGGGASQQAHYGTMRALLHHGTFALDAAPYINVDVARANGHTYSNKPPGFVLLMLPAAAVGMAVERNWPGRTGDGLQAGAHVTQVVGLGLCGLIILRVLTRLFRLLGMGRAAAPLAALGYLSTYAWTFTTTFFSHAATAALGMAALGILAEREMRQSSFSHGESALLGLLCAAGVLCEYSAVFALFPVGLVALARTRTWSQRLAMVGGALIPAGVLAAYNTACFGGPLEFSYAHLTTAHQVEGIQKGFFGASAPRWAEFKELTVGTYRGLFLPEPPAILGLAGLAAWSWRGRLAWPARTALLGTLLLLLYISGYFFWQGGSSFGPRFLVVVVPWLILGLAWAWQHARPLLWPAVALGFVAMLTGPSVCMIPHASHTPGYYNLVTFLGKKFLNGQIPAFAGDLAGESFLPADQRPTLGLGYNLGHLLGLGGMESVAPFVLGVAVLVAALLWPARGGLWRGFDFNRAASGTPGSPSSAAPPGGP